jgi:aryl-phospho-beta-D-glucosidase BglC (GH1 family)
LQRNVGANPVSGARRLEIQRAYRGVNLSGAEFAHDALHLPGVADKDYRYPTAADLRYVAGRGHRMVRLPIRWERIQPTLLGPLHAAELHRLTKAIDDARSAGLKVLVDLHNYARFIRSAAQGGATLVLGDGRLTNAHLVDLWSRLSSALRGRAGVLGYGLMNEPHNLPGVRSAVSPVTTVWSFDRGTVPWSGEADALTSLSTTAGTTHDGAGSMRISRRLLAGGSQIIRANDNARGALTPAAGTTLSGWVLVPEHTPGTHWTAQLEIQDSSYRWVAGPNTVLTPGRWSRITVTPSHATWSQHRGVAVQFASDQAGPTTATVYVDTIRQHGGTSTISSEARQWEEASQECVGAIRANQDATQIYVPGVAFSGAQNWPENHPAPWIDDPAGAIVYEAHYYFDRDNSGLYRQPFAAEQADAVRRGYASLEERATTELRRFLHWCETHAVEGFVGEIGWNNVRDSSRWNAVGDALYKLLDDAKVGTAYWAAGQWYGTSYNLSVYTGAPLSTLASPASVVEAHPSLNI